MTTPARGVGVDYTKVKTASTADMAAWIRGGVTLHDTARVFGLSRRAIQARLSTGGWSWRTGQPLDTGHKPEPASHPAFVFVAQPWADQALCAQVDPEVFFPHSGSCRQAKAVCAACPVRAECLNWALTTRERFGVYGGLSEQERRKQKRVAS